MESYFVTENHINQVIVIFLDHVQLLNSKLFSLWSVFGHLRLKQLDFISLQKKLFMQHLMDCLSLEWSILLTLHELTSFNTQ